jgi:hypothetical protein
MLNTSSSTSTTSSSTSSTLSSTLLDILPKKDDFLLADDWVWSYYQNFNSILQSNEKIKIKICKFSTINAFWGIQKMIKPPSDCSRNNQVLHYFVFRNNIDNNNNIFREHIGLNNSDQIGYLQFYMKDIDKSWENILLLMIGEDLEESVYTEEEFLNIRKEESNSLTSHNNRFIYGVEIHPERNRIWIWTKNADQGHRVEKLCEFLYNFFDKNFSALYFDLANFNNPKYEMKSGIFITN